MHLLLPYSGVVATSQFQRWAAVQQTYCRAAYRVVEMASEPAFPIMTGNWEDLPGYMQSFRVSSFHSHCNALLELPVVFNSMYLYECCKADSGQVPMLTTHVTIVPKHCAYFGCVCCSNPCTALLLCRMQLRMDAAAPWKTGTLELWLGC